MEISKISVGVETLPVTHKIRVITPEFARKIKQAITLSFISLGKVLKKVFTGILKLINYMKMAIEKKKDSLDETALNDPQDETPKNKKPVNFNKIKKAILLLIALIVLVGVTVVIKKNLIKLPGKNDSTATLGEKVEVNGPLKTVDVNKEFSFPLTDAKGKEISRIKYVIEKAELRDEIIVKGQKATAVKGRVFLIVYMKVTNEHTQKIEMNTKDFIRLSVNGNENEWLAPDIHNDPVEIQAQSTKVTRLGFPINENDTKLLLRVGQISGEKEKVELNF